MSTMGDANGIVRKRLTHANASENPKRHTASLNECNSTGVHRGISELLFSGSSTFASGGLARKCSSIARSRHERLGGSLNVVLVNPSMMLTLSEKYVRKMWGGRSWGADNS
jgi:hypothetical protein